MRFNCVSAAFSQRFEHLGQTLCSLLSVLAMFGLEHRPCPLAAAAAADAAALAHRVAFPRPDPTPRPDPAPHDTARPDPARPDAARPNPATPDAARHCTDKRAAARDFGCQPCVARSVGVFTCVGVPDCVCSVLVALRCVALWICSTCLRLDLRWRFGCVLSCVCGNVSGRLGVCAAAFRKAFQTAALAWRVLGPLW